MKLAEALQIVRRPPAPDAAPFRVALACGFTPLHLQTFLGAHLQLRSQRHHITVQAGPYGDCLGTLQRLAALPPEAAAVVLEWADFDARLGLRRLGGWQAGDLPDILAAFRTAAARFEQALAAAADAVPLALCLPTLPLPPVAFTPGWQEGPFDLDLRHELSAFAARAGAHRRVRLVSAQRLDHCSPPGQRLDVRSELTAHFPYRPAHAAAVAEALACLLWPAPPKKGLITDLDDTLWAGIVGDVGVDGVSWDLDRKSHVHALYQQLLNSLASAGVLVALASKNDPQVVDQALARKDLVLDRDRVFPREAHWQPKSASVARILQAWNVGADSVVFVDDSPLELAEVRAAFPDLECVQFCRQDEQAVYDLLQRLRDLFGKDAVAEEDTLRLASLRAGAARPEPAAPGPDQDGFLRELDAEVSLVLQKEAPDPRALELVNKTNQFNLNGRRHTDGTWLAYLKRPEAVLLTASYRDKYGPLGKIAVLAGRRQGPTFFVDTWVMSCRAFTRRIEHRCLEMLFDHFGVEEAVFDFEATPRNGPLQELLADLAGGPVGPHTRLTRTQFRRRCPALFHQVKVLTDD
jgi:FkbH-like protein